MRRPLKWIWLPVLLLATGLAIYAVLVRGADSGQEHPASPANISSGSYESGSAMLADFDISVSAEPSATTAKIEMRVKFNTPLDGVRLTYYGPVVFDPRLGADPDRGRPEVLWQGNAALGYTRTFSRVAPVPSDSIYQTSVVVENARTGRMVGAAYAMKFFSIKEAAVILADNNLAARRKELDYLIRARGYEGLSLNEIAVRDRELYWQLIYPSNVPQPRVDTVHAPDGTLIPYPSLPGPMLDELPDTIRRHFNHPDLAINKYMAAKAAGKMASQAPPSLPSALVLDWPAGLSFDDLPDSLRHLQEDPDWKSWDRAAAHARRVFEIQMWLLAQQRTAPPIER